MLGETGRRVMGPIYGSGDFLAYGSPCISAITRFRNDIKEGRRRTYNLSIWLNSKKPPQQILDASALEWEEEQDNRGLVRIAYNQVQSLHTSRNLILIGVPKDVDHLALQVNMQEKREEAWQRMIA